MSKEEQLNDYFDPYRAPAVKFESMGDGVEGIVVDRDLRQQTNFDTGEPEFWNDGRPKMEAILTLAVDNFDGEEPERVRLFVRGFMQNDIQDAIKAAGARGLAEGDYLHVVWSGEEAPKKKGHKGAKRYTVKVVPRNELDQSASTPAAKAEGK